VGFLARLPGPSWSTQRCLHPFRNNVPVYGKRKGYIPRVKEDFGDGGAFPEIHVAQYPLDLGRLDKKSTAIVAVNVNVGGGKKVFQSATDLVEKPVEPVCCLQPDKTAHRDRFCDVSARFRLS
jgi:hypothetical protein